MKSPDISTTWNGLKMDLTGRIYKQDDIKGGRGWGRDGEGGGQ